MAFKVTDGEWELLKRNFRDSRFHLASKAGARFGFGHGQPIGFLPDGTGFPEWDVLGGRVSYPEVVDPSRLHLHLYDDPVGRGGRPRTKAASGGMVTVSDSFLSRRGDLVEGSGIFHNVQSIAEVDMILKARVHGISNKVELHRQVEDAVKEAMRATGDMVMPLFPKVVEVDDGEGNRTYLFDRRHVGIETHLHAQQEYNLVEDTPENLDSVLKEVSRNHRQGTAQGVPTVRNVYFTGRDFLTAGELASRLFQDMRPCKVQEDTIKLAVDDVNRTVLNFAMRGEGEEDIASYRKGFSPTEGKMVSYASGGRINVWDASSCEFSHAVSSHAGYTNSFQSPQVFFKVAGEVFSFENLDRIRSNYVEHAAKSVAVEQDAPSVGFARK